MGGGLSRRSFLALIGTVAVQAATSKDAMAAMRHSEPLGADPTSKADILTATLSWKDSGGSAHEGQPVEVVVATNKALTNALVHVVAPADTSLYRFAVVPATTYYWRIVPLLEGKPQISRAAAGSFTTAAPTRDPQDTDDQVRYAGTPVFTGNTSAPVDPIAPWYPRKTYDGIKPPTFDEIKDRFPVPILDAPPGVLDAYWYAWKTLANIWVFPPPRSPHRAVSNLLGSPDWADVGSTMVWDSAFMLQFARYGHQAYPYIECFDNTYARQHENGFICRETNPLNEEANTGSPVNPPLFAWTEWSYYQITGDDERLARVLAPIAKHYEWWLKFQRRPNGLYWADGFQEADDSPRNDLMYYAVSANSYQALAALMLSRIAKVVGRPDLVDYFESEHAALGATVNARFWDEKHQLYNDLDKEEKFITELVPGQLCKHCHMFWPMLAEIAPKERVAALVRELSNPNSFFRSSGVPSLSADSVGYNPPTGDYWHGAVWPPIQSMVQSGLAACGQWDLAQQFAARYSAAVAAAYVKETPFRNFRGETEKRGQTISEYLYPDEPTNGGVSEFVGWGGIGPIQDLVEYTLGFNASAPANTITWRIRRTDRHGIAKLGMGKSTYDLVCAARESATAPCHITVKSAQPFTLRVIVNGKEHLEPLKAGEQALVIA